MKTEGNSIFSENNAGKQCVMVLTYMSRATDSERAQRVNSAFDLLVRGHSLSEAAQVLTESFALSRRQAYHYLQEAQELALPLPVAQPTIPVTIKIPGEVVGELRAYAQESGRTMGGLLGARYRRIWPKHANMVDRRRQGHDVYLDYVCDRLLAAKLEQVYGTSRSGAPSL